MAHRATEIGAGATFFVILAADGGAEPGKAADVVVIRRAVIAIELGTTGNSTGRWCGFLIAHRA